MSNTSDIGYKDCVAALFAAEVNNRRKQFAGRQCQVSVSVQVLYSRDPLAHFVAIVQWPGFVISLCTQTTPRKTPPRLSIWGWADARLGPRSVRTWQMELPRSTYYDQLTKGRLITADNL